MKHHIEEILLVFTKTLLLKDGTVYASGNTEELVKSVTAIRIFRHPSGSGLESGAAIVIESEKLNNKKQSIRHGKHMFITYGGIKDIGKLYCMFSTLF